MFYLGASVFCQHTYCCDLENGL
uniref:Uncharacterized protein n=1 Tax=Arundo donax TaxID=35708 RepID=A0A0A8ZR49_ARUDO